MFQPELLTKGAQQEGTMNEWYRDKLGFFFQGRTYSLLNIGNLCSFPYGHLDVTPYELNDPGQFQAFLFQLADLYVLDNGFRRQYQGGVIFFPPAVLLYL